MGIVFKHLPGNAAGNRHDGLIGSPGLRQLGDGGMTKVVEAKGRKPGGLASVAPSRPPRLDRASGINLAVIGVSGINPGVFASREHVMLRLAIREVFGPGRQGSCCIDPQSFNIKLARKQMKVRSRDVQRLKRLLEDVARLIGSINLHHSAPLPSPKLGLYYALPDILHAYRKDLEYFDKGAIPRDPSPDPPTMAAAQSVEPNPAMWKDSIARSSGITVPAALARHGPYGSSSGLTRTF
jgi:hypothetical protein